MGLCENIEHHLVRDLPLRKALVVDPSASVRNAIERMTHNRLGCVVVVSSKGKLLGTFTEGKVVHLLARSPAFLDDPVRDHLSETWISVKTSEPIFLLVYAMMKRRPRFACVTDDAGRVVGLTGQRGILEYIAEHFPKQVQLAMHRAGDKSYFGTREGA